MDKQNVTPAQSEGQAETLAGFPVIGTPKAQRVIDWSKPVRTAGGQRLVHIYAIDHRLKKPVVGYDSLFDSANQWYLDGSFQCDQSSGMDLENIPEVPHV